MINLIWNLFKNECDNFFNSKNLQSNDIKSVYHCKLKKDVTVFVPLFYNSNWALMMFEYLKKDKNVMNSLNICNMHTQYNDLINVFKDNGLITDPITIYPLNLPQQEGELWYWFNLKLLLQSSSCFFLKFKF